MYLFPSVTLDLFSDLDKSSGLGVMGYDVSTSTLNEVFMKLEGTSTAEQGKSVCILHGRSISKCSCINLVFIMSYAWFTLTNVTTSKSDSAVWERLSLFLSIVMRTEHRSLLGVSQISLWKWFASYFSSFLLRPDAHCFLDTLRMSQPLNQGHKVWADVSYKNHP